jgi:hypothetical protein
MILAQLDLLMFVPTSALGPGAAVPSPGRQSLPVGERQTRSANERERCFGGISNRDTTAARLLFAVKGDFAIVAAV